MRVSIPIAATISIAAFVSISSAVAGELAIDVPNFQKVSDSIYRGAQPTVAGFGILKTMGILTVLDLRESSHARTEEAIVKAQGMRYINIPMAGLEAPSDAHIAQALALLGNAAAGPVFVHCRRGADRTGTVLACYRISHDHWDNSKALAEAKQRGMSKFQIAMYRYIRAYSGNAVAAAPATGQVQVSN